MSLLWSRLSHFEPQAMMQRWFKLSVVVRASRSLMAVVSTGWCSNKTVVSWWLFFLSPACFPWLWPIFWTSFSSLPINNVSSDIILIHSSFHFFAPKNPTDTTPYLRNQAWATKVFHLDCCNSLGAFCMYCSFCLKYFFAPILVTCFHTSSGLC